MQLTATTVNRLLVVALLALSAFHVYQFRGNADALLSTISASFMTDNEAASSHAVHDELSLVAQTLAAQSLLDCDPSTSHPVLNSIPSSADNPIRVGVVTSRDPYDNHEGKHFMIDGSVGSDYLSLQAICILETMDGCPLDLIQQVASSKFDDEASDEVKQKEFDDSAIQLWIVDTIRTEMGPLAKNEALVVDPLIKSKTYKWKVLLVDYGDFPSRAFLQRHSLKVPPGSNNPNSAIDASTYPHLRYALRSRITGRMWTKDQKKPMQIGRLNSDIQGMVTRTGDVPINMPYAIRSDTLEALHQVLPSCKFTKYPISPELHKATRLTSFMHRPPPHTERLMDVSHLWDENDATNYGIYRSNVSKVVNKFDGQPIHVDSSNAAANSDNDGAGQLIKSSTKLHGRLGNDGRSQVDPRYVRALLSSKIVVITQRDLWEDHYRLMEALICGAMILHDTMLTLPPWLKNGTSIVFFQDLDDLSQKIHHYLQHEEERLDIAEQGWMIAMGRHQSWHRMEGAVFGCPLTGVF